MRDLYSVNLPRSEPTAPQRHLLTACQEGVKKSLTC